MASTDEINALRRLMESINRLSTSNAASIGKLTTEQQAQRQELETLKQTANRAIQMCNELDAKITRCLHLP